MLKNRKNIRKISNIPQTCRERYLTLLGNAAQPLTANGINFSGISYLRAGYENGHPEGLSRHMVIFTKAGEGFLHTLTESYPLTSGTLMVVPPGHPMHFGVVDNHWDILWFYMLDIPYWQTLKKKGIDYRPTNMIPKIETVMEGYLTETQPESPADKPAQHFAELISFYLDQALEINPDNRGDEMKNKLDRLWHQVMANPAGNWQKEEMARQLHTSPSTLDRLVKKYYGLTPWQKVIQIRMEQAKIILRNTNYPMQAIAERLGYANEFIFSSAFKKYTNLAPKFYRQEKSL